MSSNRIQLSQFAHKLQTQTDIPHWAIAQENVINTLARNTNPEWGPRLKHLARLMRITERLGFSDLLLFCLSCIRIIKIQLNLKPRPAQQIDAIQRVFVGFGASQEETLFQNTVKQASTTVIRINAISYQGVNSLGIPRLLPMLKMCAALAFGHTRRLKTAIPEIADHVSDFLTVSAFNLAPYITYRHVWRLAKNKGLKEVTFIAADMSAFAGVDENVFSIFHQHGLLNIPVIIPRVNRMEVITECEEIYFKSALKQTVVVRQPSAIHKNSTAKNNTLLILPFSLSVEPELHIIDGMIQWAENHNYQVVIRPSPTTPPEVMAVYRQHFAKYTFDDNQRSFTDTLACLNPKLVAAWWSTALVTALEYGCLPISLSNPDSCATLTTMIYPMAKRVLFWRRDQTQIQHAVETENNFQSQLQYLNQQNDICLLS